jgi:hypothetical protein
MKSPVAGAFVVPTGARADHGSIHKQHDQGGERRLMFAFFPFGKRPCGMDAEKAPSGDVQTAPEDAGGHPPQNVRRRCLPESALSVSKSRTLFSRAVR